MKKSTLLFSCEHASNAIPKKYKRLFLKKINLLNTHRGFDNGSRQLGASLGRFFKSPVIYGQFSRLLIDLNRSAHHRNAFSEFTAFLTKNEKEDLIKNYHTPHWNKVQGALSELWKVNTLIIHIGVHSFTPILNNQKRNADIGILYDPSRKKERELALRWQKALQHQTPLRVRLNYPYLGKLDGLTTKLRAKYSAKSYLGLELEINQELLKNKQNWLLVKKQIIESLYSILS